MVALNFLLCSSLETFSLHGMYTNYTNSVRTPHREECALIRKISGSALCIVSYRHIHKLTGTKMGSAGGTYTNQWALRGFKKIHTHTHTHTHTNKRKRIRGKLYVIGLFWKGGQLKKSIENRK